MSKLGVWTGMAALGVCLAFAGCGNRGGQQSIERRRPAGGRTESAGKKNSAVHFESRGVKELSWQEGGRYVMRASAESLSFDEETGKSALKQARVVLYKHGSEAAVVTAADVETDGKKRELTATGGVSARSSARGLSVSASKLNWSQRTQKLIGRGGVRAKSDVAEVSADTMIAESDLKHVTLRSASGGRASVNMKAVE